MRGRINIKAVEREMLKQAAIWLDKRCDHDWTGEDEANFQIWLGSSPQTKKAYNQVAATWNDPLLSEALKEALPATKPKFKRMAWVVARAAAVGAGLSMMVYGIMFIKPIEPVQPISTASIASGSVHKIVILADDTRLDMNVATKAQVAYSATARTLDLQSGEVFLDVKPDKARPFEVRTAFGKIRVTGTSFNVNTRSGQLEVSVRRGNVQVQSPFGATASLTAGQNVRVRDGKLSVVRAVSFASIDAWRHPWLETNGISVADLAVQLEAEHGINIIIGANDVGRLIVSGRFSTLNPKELFQDLGLVHGFTVTGSDDRFRIEKAK
jgi:transmembrane sensor